MGSLDVLIRGVDKKCAMLHLKVAHALSTINTDKQVFLPGLKPFTTLASHICTSLQMYVTDPRHTYAN